MQETFTQLLKELGDMPIKDTGLLEQAKYVKGYINVLTERFDELKGIIMEDMQSKQEIKKETEFGKFSIAERATWKYSSLIEELKESVKLAEKEEQESGVATKEITNYLLVK